MREREIRDLTHMTMERNKGKKRKKKEKESMNSDVKDVLPKLEERGLLD